MARRASQENCRSFLGWNLVQCYCAIGSLSRFMVNSIFADCRSRQLSPRFDSGLSGCAQSIPWRAFWLQKRSLVNFSRMSWIWRHYFRLRLSLNLLTRLSTAATVRFNFAAMRMMDALDSTRALRRSSSSGVHLLLVLSGTIISQRVALNWGMQADKNMFVCHL